MKKFIAFLYNTLTFMAFNLICATSVFADEVPIPDKGISRIKWSIQCSGLPTSWLFITVALLVILIIISVIYYSKISGGKK